MVSSGLVRVINLERIDRVYPLASIAGDKAGSLHLAGFSRQEPHGAHQAIIPLDRVSAFLWEREKKGKVKIIPISGV